MQKICIWIISTTLTNCQANAKYSRLSKNIIPVVSTNGVVFVGFVGFLYLGDNLCMIKKSKAKKPLDSPILKAKGLKVTPARVAVLDFFTKSNEPLSIQNILDGIKHVKVDQATVYRITEALKKIGLIREVNLEHGHAHFELNTKEHHHHIICENCGKVVDISNCNLKGLEKEVLNKSGFSRINRHSLEFFGLCSKCQARNRPTA